MTRGFQCPRCSTELFLSCASLPKAEDGGGGEQKHQPWNGPHPDDCTNCGCRKSGHHPVGCEGSGGQCRCPGYKAKPEQKAEAPKPEIAKLESDLRDSQELSGLRGHGEERQKVRADAAEQQLAEANAKFATATAEKDARIERLKNELIQQTGCHPSELQDDFFDSIRPVINRRMGDEIQKRFKVENDLVAVSESKLAKPLREYEQAIVEATTLMHEWDKAVSINNNALWITVGAIKARLQAKLREVMK